MSPATVPVGMAQAKVVAEELLHTRTLLMYGAMVGTANAPVCEGPMPTCERMLGQHPIVKQNARIHFFIAPPHLRQSRRA